MADPTFLTLQRQHEFHRSDIAEQHRRILNRSKEDFLAEMQIRRPYRSREIIKLFSQARFQTSIHAFEILTPPNPDYMQLINTLDVPSLLIISDEGSVVSPEVAAELARLNLRLEVVQILEVGHGVPHDQPECFSTVVQIFLRSVRA